MQAEEQIRVLKNGLRVLAESHSLYEHEMRALAQRTIDSVPLGVSPPLGVSKLVYRDQVAVRQALHSLQQNLALIRATLEKLL